MDTTTAAELLASKTPAIVFESFLKKAKDTKREIEDDIRKAQTHFHPQNELKFREELKNFLAKEDMIITMFIKSGYIPLFASAQELSKSFVVYA
jgi:hypothetical protein